MYEKDNIRDAHNSMEFFDEREFRMRYRFNKDTVANILLPLIAERLDKFSNCGLPIPSILHLLISLRLYATCNFQVVSGD